MIFASLSLMSFTVLAFLNTTELGIYVSCLTIIYFGLRLILNPKIRLRIDVLGLFLLAVFALYVSQQIVTILK